MFWPTSRSSFTQSCFWFPFRLRSIRFVSRQTTKAPNKSREDLESHFTVDKRNLMQRDTKTTFFTRRHSTNSSSVFSSTCCSARLMSHVEWNVMNTRLPAMRLESFLISSCAVFKGKCDATRYPILPLERNMISNDLGTKASFSCANYLREEVQTRLAITEV